MIALMVVCTASVRQRCLSDGAGVARNDIMYMGRSSKEKSLAGRIHRKAAETPIEVLRSGGFVVSEVLPL